MKYLLRYCVEPNYGIISCRKYSTKLIYTYLALAYGLELMTIFSRAPGFVEVLHPVNQCNYSLANVVRNSSLIIDTQFELKGRKGEYVAMKMFIQNQQSVMK